MDFLPGHARSRWAALLVVAFVVLASLPGTALAAERAGGSVVVAEGETVDDLRAFGGTVVVRGTVDGDLEAFAGSVHVTGTVTGDVEAVAGNVQIAGTVGGDVSVAAGSLVVEPDASVGGSLEAGAGNVLLAGTVEGDARVGADTLRLAGTASIGGDLEYDAEEVVGLDGAAVAGTVTQVQGLDVGVDFAPIPVVPDWLGAIYGLFANLLLGVLLLLAFPRFSDRVADRVAAHPARTGGVGLLTLVAVPVVLVVLALTIVGIPLTLVGAFLFALVAWIAYVYGAYAVGAWLLSLADEANRWAALAVGLIAATLVGLVPLVGGLATFLVFLVGLGALAALAVVTWRRRRGSPTRDPSGDDEADAEGSDDDTGTQPA